MKKAIVIPCLICLALAAWLLWPSASADSTVSIPAPTPAEAASLTTTPGEQLTPASGRTAAPDPLDAKMRAEAIRFGLERLHLAIEAADAEDYEAAYSYLARLLEDDPRNLPVALAAFGAEHDPSLLSALARLIAPHLPTADAELQAAALALLEESSTPNKRTAALGLFTAYSDPSPELNETVLRLSREDASYDVRIVAIHLVGTWATKNLPRWTEWSAELVKTIDSSDHTKVRGHAIQVISLHPDSAPPQILAAMAEYMKHEPSAQTRAIASHALGGASADLRGSAIELLQEAFYSEQELNNRRSLITQMARAAGEDAIDVLLQLKPDDLLLEQDIEDYLQILRARPDFSFEEVFYLKFALDAERDTVSGSLDHRD